MKTRKILTLLLVAAMMLSFSSIAAMAISGEVIIGGQDPINPPGNPPIIPGFSDVAQVGDTQYTTLAAAIAAANELEGATVTLLCDYDMEANEPGYGWTTAYVANGETTPRNNMIAISGNGLTFDLNGHTLSNLFNNTFNVTGANVTVTNGTMQIGELYYGSYNSNTGKVTLYDAPKTCSYVMFVERAENFTVNNLTTLGGINVAGGSTATFNNYSFSGTTYYAIMAQENSVVTVNGGVYDKSVPGAANYLIWVEDGSTMNIVDGTFIKGSAKFYTGIKPVITGGTFDFDPTNSGVAADYTAVDNGNGTWTVVSAYAAEVNGTKYETLEAAIAAAEAGNTIKLLKDVTVNTGAANSRLAISKSMTIDGNGFTVSINNRGFGVGTNASAPVDVTFRNVTITNAQAGGRCVDTRGNLNSLTLDNVTLKTTGTSGYMQPLTIGGNQATAATVTITDSTIQASEDGSKGYAIITFNPVEMTITGSTLKGWACLYIKGIDGSAGSAGSVFTVTDSTIVSKNVNAGETNAFGAVKIEDNNVTVNIADSEIVLSGPKNLQGIMSLDAYNTLTGVNVNLRGEITATMTGDAVFATNTTETAKLTIYGGTYNADPSAYVAEGYEAVALEGEDAGKFKVGKVQAKDIALADEKTEGYDATYTATKQVIDNETGEVLAESAAVKVNVKAVTDEVATDVSIDKVDVAAVLDTVMDAVDNTAEINVEISISTSDPVVDTVENTITYEVHPVATVFVDDTRVAEKAISNDDLVDDAFFTITLPVPNALVNADGKVKVRHISEGHQDEVALYAVAGTSGNYTVTFTIDHFSEFELTLDETGSTGNILNTGFNLALEDEIVINFKTLGLVDGNGDPADPAKFKVVYTFDGVTSEKYLTNATEIETTVVARCAAKQLVDEVIVKVYYEDVIIYNRTYSVKTYCMNKINSTNANDKEELKELCKAILAYGAEAQNRFNYKTNNLANADINYTVDVTVPAAFNNSYMPDGKDAVSDGGLIGKALELEYKTNIVVYFPYYAGDDYVVYANGTQVAIEYTTLNGTMPVVRAEIPGIAAKNLDQLVEIRIEDSTRDTDYTFEYSPLNWAYKASANATSEAQLANALYNYYLTAVAFFNA